MEQKRHRDQPRKDIFEDFRILRNSDYWPCLSAKTQQDILSLLGQRRNEEGDSKYILPCA